MLKKPYYLAFGLVFLISLVLLNLPGKASSQLKLVISDIFIPIFGLSTATHQALDQASSGVMPRRVLLAELEKLQKENQQLKLELMQGADVLRENAQLRTTVAWKQRSGWNVKLARILAREPANWWKALQINLGSNDNITTNTVVLTSDGLVGRVDQVGTTSARVLLLGDPNCRVSALIEETREAGVIAPSSQTISDQTLVEMTYISRHSQLKPGQKVITSGLGGLFPKGIPIGRIMEVQLADHGLFHEARVKLSANLKDLEEVWVLLP